MYVANGHGVLKRACFNIMPVLVLTGRWRLGAAYTTQLGAQLSDVALSTSK